MSRLLNKVLRRRAGQNTVEYLLMLAVVVGVVLIAGIALKQYMPSLWATIQGKIGGAAEQLSTESGSSR